MAFFEGIDRNFGFGFMRLPMIGDNVDIEQTKKRDSFRDGCRFCNGVSSVGLRRSSLWRKYCNSIICLSESVNEWHTYVKFHNWIVQ